MSRLMRPTRTGGVMKIQVDGGGEFSMDEVLYVPGLSLNGIEGLSPIAYAREAVGLGKAAELFGAAFFGNGANVSGTLTHPKNLTDGAYRRLMESWNAKHQGVNNANKLTILEEGMTYNRVGIPPEDAQFLQTRKFQVQEIARIYRIPPHMLADLDRSTNNNIEQQSLDFLTNTLATYTCKFEQECDAKLLPPGGQYYTSFNERSLLRGDIKSRMAFYASGRQNGYLSANDVRGMEDLNQIKGGDTYLSPTNMTDAADPVEETDPPTPADPSDDEPDSPKKKKKDRALPVPTNRTVDNANAMRRLAKSHARLFAAAAERLVRKEARAAERFDGRDAGAFEQWAEKFYGEHRDHLREAYIVPAEALAEAAAGGDGLALDLAAAVQSAVNVFIDAELKSVRESLRTAFGAGRVKEFCQEREKTRPAAVASELSQKIVDIVALKLKG